MIKARKVKERQFTGYGGTAGSCVLWEVAGEYVVTSALAGAFDTGQPETLVFKADAEGKVIDWEGLPGGFSGAMNHELAIEVYCQSLTEGAPM